MTTRKLKFALVALGAVTVLSSSGCLVQRTVKEGGQVVSQEYVVETPIINAFERGERGNY